MCVRIFVCVLYFVLELNEYLLINKREWKCNFFLGKHTDLFISFFNYDYLFSVFWLFTCHCRGRDTHLLRPVRLRWVREGASPPLASTVNPRRWALPGASAKSSSMVFTPSGPMTEVTTISPISFSNNPLFFRSEIRLELYDCYVFDVIIKLITFRCQWRLNIGKLLSYSSLESVKWNTL